MLPRDLIVFPHIPKTGGSTVIHHLARALGDRYCDLDCELGATSYTPEVLVIQGHKIRYCTQYPDRRALYFTILRDPADWLVSVYHHDASRRGLTGSFHDWYARKGPNAIDDQAQWPNPLTRWIARYMLPEAAAARDLPAICGMFEGFWYLATTATLIRDLVRLGEQLGLADNRWPHKRAAGTYDEIDRTVIPRTYELSQAMRRRIYAENAQDLELWQYICNLREARYGETTV
jgi:hypothetical protein